MLRTIWDFANNLIAAGFTAHLPFWVINAFNPDLISWQVELGAWLFLFGLLLGWFWFAPDPPEEWTEKGLGE